MVLLQTFPEPRRVAPGVEWIGLRDDRFKRIIVRIHLEMPLDAASSARTLLLPVLEQGSAGHPRRLAIAQALQEAYGAGLDFSAERSGECHQAVVRLSCVGDRFLPQGERALPPLLALTRELLEQPRRGPGGVQYDREIVERERGQLLRRIRALRDDRSSWAEQRFLEVMCEGEAYARPSWGSEAEVEALSVEDLEAARQSLLQRARIVAVAIGPLEPAELADYLSAWFGARPEPPRWEEPAAKLPVKRRSIREEVSCDQARFHAGFRCPMPADPRAREALALAVSVLGGGVHGRLFRIVREQRSQAYSIHAQLRARKGLMTVEAGLDAAHAASVSEEVDKQIADLAERGPAPEELEHARRFLCDRLTSLGDSPSGLLAYLARERALGLARAPAERIAWLQSLTPADVAVAARRWIPDTNYLLAPPTPVLAAP